jgi:hypothetical protein
MYGIWTFPKDIKEETKTYNVCVQKLHNAFGQRSSLATIVVARDGIK